MRSIDTGFEHPVSHGSITSPTPTIKRRACGRRRPAPRPPVLIAGVARCVTQRVGVRVHLRVTGEIEPTVAITDVDVKYDPSINPFAPGRLEISYTVTNTGNVRLSSRQQAEIAGLFGLPTGADTGESGLVGEQAEILPGQSAEVAAEIEAVAGRVTTGSSPPNRRPGPTPPEVVELVRRPRCGRCRGPSSRSPRGRTAPVWRRRRRCQRRKVEQLVAAAGPRGRAWRGNPDRGRAAHPRTGRQRSAGLGEQASR